MKSQSFQVPNSVELSEQSGLVDNAQGSLLLPGIAFLAGVTAFAAIGADLTTMASVTIAAMAVSLAAAVNAVANDRPSTTAERLAQGVVYAALVLLSQNFVAHAAPEGSLTLLTVSTFVVFLIAALAECTLTALAAYGLGKFRSALGGPILAAKIIDNRFFGGAGTLDV